MNYPYNALLLSCYDGSKIRSFIRDYNDDRSSNAKSLHCSRGCHDFGNKETESADTRTYRKAGSVWTGPSAEWQQPGAQCVCYVQVLLLLHTAEQGGRVH